MAEETPAKAWSLGRVAYRDRRVGEHQRERGGEATGRRLVPTMKAACITHNTRIPSEDGHGYRGTRM